MMRPHGAETVAAGFHQFDFSGKASFLQFGDQCLFYLEASGCMTACSSTEQQMRAKVRGTDLPFDFIQVCDFQLGHYDLPQLSGDGLSVMPYGFICLPPIAP